MATPTSSSRRGRPSQMTVEILRQVLKNSPQPRMTPMEVASIKAAVRGLPGARFDPHLLVSAIHWDGQDRAAATIQRTATDTWAIVLDDADLIVGATLSEVLRELVVPRPVLAEAQRQKVEAAFAGTKATIYYDDRQVTVCASFGDERFEAAFTQRPQGWVLRMDGKWRPGTLEQLLQHAQKRQAKLAKKCLPPAEPEPRAPPPPTDEPPQLDAAMLAELEDLPKLSHWDPIRKPKRRKSRLLYLGDEGPAQARAVAYLRTHEVEVRDTVASFLLRVHQRQREDHVAWGDEDELRDQGLCKLLRAADIPEVFDIVSLNVTVTEHNGVAYVALRITCPWAEHGLGLLLYKRAVVYFGNGEAGELEAARDARRRARGRPPATRRVPAAASCPAWKRLLSKQTDKPLVSVQLEDVSAPDAAQRKAIAHLERKDAVIAQRVLAAILDEYWGWTWREKEEDEARLAHYRLPAVNDTQRLAKVIRLERITILPVARDGHAYVGFAFKCAWLPFSGLGVLVYKDKVVVLGGFEIISMDSAFQAASWSHSRLKGKAPWRSTDPFTREIRYERDPWWAPKPPTPFARRSRV